MKPILFNTEMVRAILDGRKTVTRRVVKLHAKNETLVGIKYLDSLYAIFSKGKSTGYEFVRVPYRSGDILYVRETWCNVNTKEHPSYFYRADNNRPHDFDGLTPWRPSIHMPSEAARIFLRVLDVRVEKLQSMTEADAVAEGFEAIRYDHPGGYPCTDCMNTGYLEPAMLGFVETWNSTIKPKDRSLYGWGANPWVWIIRFDRITKEEVRDRENQSGRHGARCEQEQAAGTRAGRR